LQTSASDPGLTTAASGAGGLPVDPASAPMMTMTVLEFGSGAGDEHPNAHKAMPAQVDVRFTILLMIAFSF
jgi:hypothetical protein